MSSRTERGINPEISNPPNLEVVPGLTPSEVFKNRLGFIRYSTPYGDIKRWLKERKEPVDKLESQEGGEDWEKRRDLWLNEVALHNGRKYNYQIYKYFSLSREYIDDAKRYRKGAEKLPEESHKRQEKERLAESAEYMHSAVTYTIDQVREVTGGYKEIIHLADKLYRNIYFDRAQEEGEKAKEALYMARTKYYVDIEEKWVCQRVKQEEDKRKSAYKQMVEIEFPEWLKKDIEESSEENLAEKSDEEKLRRIALRQVERFLPKKEDATQAQRDSIIFEWMRDRPTELKMTGEEWDKDVRALTEDHQWIIDNTVDVPDGEDKKTKAFALKTAYVAWTDPDLLRLELTKGGWGKAIVKALHIP